MAWTSQEIEKLEEIVTKLAAESHMAVVGKDDGLIPIYSLVTELADGFPEEPALANGLEAIQEMLQPMLDEATPFDAPTLEAVRTFANWCADSLFKLKTGEPLGDYLSTHDGESTLPDWDSVASEEAHAFEAKGNICVDATWSDEKLTEFESLAQQFSAELLLVDKGSDEGMLPIYSLIKDIQADFDGFETVRAATVPIVAQMDRLLDSASLFDELSVSLLTEFNIWLEAARNEIKQGREPYPFESNLDEEAAPAEESAPVVLEEESNQFTESDVVMDLNMAENQELLVEFHTEAIDHLGQIETAVLELEHDVTNSDAINSMFRSFHTIKGVAGFLNLIPMNRLAHEVESLMDLVRNEQLGVYTGIIDLVLESKDTVAKLIEQISDALSNGTLPNTVIHVSHLMQRARWAMEGEESYSEKMGKPKAEPPAQTIEKTLEPQSEEPETQIAPTPPEQEAAPAAPQKAQGGKRRMEGSTIRVNTWKLDNLMDMVGELVIVQSQLHESNKEQGNSNSNSNFQSNMSQLTRITKELQHTSMALRMIPVKSTFQKMGRIIRDLGAKSGKKVRFEVQGEDTELDRNVVEEIGDPLVHMVRNAIDHGLEPPEDRLASGKSETGYVSLKAYHQGSNIVIELKDDGRGIDPDKILKKAIANGVIREDEQLSKEEIYKLLFAPGFSTAEEITDISGRGVGMDVVKKNIEKLRGKIETESEMGKGSVFKVLLPLTMAIVDGLVVKVGDDRFILPTTSVKVALRPDAETLAKIQGNEEVLNIRGKIIPLFRLHNHFQIPNAVSDPRNATVVVVETAGKPFGLLVDDMVSKQEVVIKSLGSMMQGIPGVTGGAILGDGTIALILDPATLVA